MSPHSSTGTSKAAEPTKGSAAFVFPERDQPEIDE